MEGLDSAQPNGFQALFCVFGRPHRTQTPSFFTLGPAAASIAQPPFTV